MTAGQKVKVLLIGAELVDLLFTLVEWDYDRVYQFYWPGFFAGYGDWDGRLTIAGYVYHWCAHVSIMCRVIAAWISPGGRVFLVVFWLEVADWADFVIHYNHTIFTVQGWPVEFSLFKFLALLFYLHVYGVDSTDTRPS